MKPFSIGKIQKIFDEVSAKFSQHLAKFSHGMQKRNPTQYRVYQFDSDARQQNFLTEMMRKNSCNIFHQIAPKNMFWISQKYCVLSHFEVLQFCRQILSTVGDTTRFLHNLIEESWLPQNVAWTDRLIFMLAYCA